MDAAQARSILRNGASEFLSASQPEETKKDTSPTTTVSDDHSEDSTPNSATVESSASTETATQTSEHTDDSDDKSKKAPKDSSNPPKDKPKDKSKEKPAEDLGDPSKLPYPKATNPDSNPAQYKANKAFIKQKTKYKAKISDLEAQIAGLKKQLATANNIDPSKLDESQKANLGFDKRLIEHDIQNLMRNRQATIDEYESAQADEIHQSRIDKCFTSQEEKDHYNLLLENGRDKFVEFLSQVDPDNTVLQYLDDTDNSPLLVRLLMTRPDVLRQVVSKRSPFAKAIELKTIETHLMQQRKLRSTSPKTPPASDSKKPASVATTGRVVGQPSHAPAAPKTHSDWREHLKQHP